MDKLKRNEEDIGDIQGLLDKWNRLRLCRQTLEQKNQQLEQELDAKKSK